MAWPFGDAMMNGGQVTRARLLIWIHGDLLLRLLRKLLIRWVVGMDDVSSGRLFFSRRLAPCLWAGAIPSSESTARISEMQVAIFVCIIHVICAFRRSPTLRCGCSMRGGSYSGQSKLARSRFSFLLLSNRACVPVTLAQALVSERKRGERKKERKKRKKRKRGRGREEEKEEREKRKTE